MFYDVQYVILNNLLVPHLCTTLVGADEVSDLRNDVCKQDYQNRTRLLNKRKNWLITGGARKASVCGY